MSDLSVACPCCGASNADPFEVLTFGSIDQLTCEGCARKIFYFLGDCDECSGETVICWPDRPVGVNPSDLRCASCRGFFGHAQQARDYESIGDKPDAANGEQ